MKRSDRVTTKAKDIHRVSAFDRERILNFIQAFRDKAPEPNAR